MAKFTGWQNPLRDTQSNIFMIYEIYAKNYTISGAGRENILARTNRNAVTGSTLQGIVICDGYFEGWPSPQLWQ